MNAVSDENIRVLQRNMLFPMQLGPNIILKQNPQDVFINACNQDILSLWRGNVDQCYRSCGPHSEK